MKTIVTASTAQDFLALVPQLVGFRSEESVVFVAFRGKRSIAAMRYDLPDTESAAAQKRIATTLVGIVSKLPAVDAVLPVVYTAQSFVGESGMPGERFIHAAIERFEFSGITVKDALCVAGDGWGSYLDESCPPGGRPLAVIENSRIGEMIPVDERLPLGSIEEWSRLPAVDRGEKERVARRIDTLAEVLAWLGASQQDDDGRGSGQTRGRGSTRGRGQAGGRGPARGSGPTGVHLPADGRESSGGRTAATWADRRTPLTDAEIEAVLDAYLLDDLPYFVEMVFQCDPTSMPDRTAAMLIHLAQSPVLRDAILMQWAFDRATGDRVLDDAEHFGRGAMAGALDTSNLMLGQGPRPDSDRIESAVTIAKALAARAPHSHRPPLFCMIAWLNWAVGRSSVAGRFVDSARAIDPGYGFAEILETMLGRGMLPEWAFEPR